MTSADATRLFATFSAGALLSLSAPVFARFLSALFSSTPVPLAILLKELEAAKARVAGLTSEALALVAKAEGSRATRRAASGRDGGPLPLPLLHSALDKALAAADDTHFADAPFSEALISAALAARRHTPAVAAAESAVMTAHPLYVPPARILELQARIVEREVAEHAAAVEDARARSIALDSQAFAVLLGEHLAARAAEGMEGGSGSGVPSSFAPLILQSDASLAPRAPLWTYIVGHALLEEKKLHGHRHQHGRAHLDAYAGFGAQWAAVMAAEKEQLRALGLTVS